MPLALTLSLLIGPQSAQAVNPYRVVGSVPLSPGPVRTALTPDGRFLWVTSDAGSSLTQIDVSLSTPAVINKISLSKAGGWGPYAITISADGSQVWATNASAGQVVEVDTANCLVTSTSCVPTRLFTGLPGTLFGIALSPDGSDVWVADWIGGRIYQLDASTGAVKNTVVALGNPHDIKIAPNPAAPTNYLVWVADSKPGVAGVYSIDSVNCSTVNASTCQPSVAVPTGSNANDLAVNKAGTKLWVTNWGDGTVSQIDTATRTIDANIDVGGSPFGVAVSDDNASLWVTNWNNVATRVALGVTPMVVESVAVGSQQNGVAISPDGSSIWIANGGSSSISQVSNSTVLAVPGSPILTEVTPLRGVANVSWSPPSSGGGFVSGYTATAFDAQTNAEISSCSTSSNSCAINGLDTSASYIVTVTASNAAGTSAPSPASAAFTANVWTPGAIANTVNVGGYSVTGRLTPDGKHLWVASDAGGTLAQIDVTVNPPIVLNTIALGRSGGWGPYGIAISSDGSQVWATNASLGQIVEVDTANCQVTNAACDVSKSITVVAGASSNTALFGITLSPDNQIVWASDWTGGRVYQIDGFTGEVLNEVVVPGNPHALWAAPNPLDPADYLVWAADSAPHVAGIYAIDAANCTSKNSSICLPSTPIGTGSNANDVVLNKSGTKAWVANWGSGSVSQVNTITGVVEHTVSLGGNPFDLAVSKDEKSLWVTNWNETLSQIDLSAPTPSVVLNVPLAGWTMNGLAISANNQFVWVVTGGVLYQVVNHIPPSAPTNLIATESINGAELTWNASASDGGSPITQYIVTADDGNGGFFTCTSSNLQCSLSGLTPGVSYSVSVQAQNGTGISDPSDYVVVVPIAEAPQPVDVNISGGTSPAIFSQPSQVAGVSTYSCSITGLSSGVSYQFAVVAHNSGGDGPVSAVTTALTPANASSNSATLTWTADTSGGRAVSYFYARMTSSDSPGLWIPPISGTCSSVILPTGVANSTLSSLTFSTGALTPSFFPGITTYSQSVLNNVTALTLSLTSADLGAKVKVNGVALSSINLQSTIGLSVGQNHISIVCFGSDGVTRTKYSITVTRLQPAYTPSLSTTLPTSTGFNFNITNYSPNYLWTVTSSIGVVVKGVASGTMLPVSITGLASGQTAVVTVSTAQIGYAGASKSLNGSAGLVAPSPTFDSPRATPTGFTVNVTNYSGAYKWIATSLAGKVAVGKNSKSTLPVTVSGLAPGQSTTLNITASKPGYLSASASVIGSASLGPALVPVLSSATPTTSGFTVNITNYQVAFNFVATIAAGDGSVTVGTPSGSVLPITVSGMTLSSSTLRVSAQRSGYATGSVTTTAYAKPVIATISSSTAKIGATLVITGSNLWGATSVMIGGTSKSVASFAVISPTRVIVSLASAVTGPVVVVTPGGIGVGGSVTVSPQKSAPGAVTLDSAFGGQGTALTLSGTNLGAATSVMRGSKTVQFKVLAANQILLSIPAGMTSGAFTVSTPGGSIVTPVFSVGAVSFPTVTTGAIVGKAGTFVSFSGSNLGAALTVTVNGSPTSFIVTSSSSVSVLIPHNSAVGSAAVVFTTPAGSVASSSLTTT